MNIHGAIHGGKNFRKVPYKKIDGVQSSPDVAKFSKEDDEKALRALNRARHELKFKR